MKNDLDILRKAIGKTKRVSDSTVVRYERDLNRNHEPFRYVAIYIAATDQWYVSGITGGSYDYDDFMHMLGTASNVEVVVGWASMEG